MSNWYKLTPEQVLSEFQTDAAAGLSAAEARQRLQRDGPNELVERGRKSPWLIFWQQLTSTLIVVLIVAAIASAALGDLKDAVAIVAIVVLNAVIGFRQEYKAEQAMASLKKMAAPTVRVRRDGHVVEMPSRDLVTGDVVMLETGNLVPADGRVLESVELRTQEAALTGESEPVTKDTDARSERDLPLGDRTNMAYMGTVVTYGRGLMVVTETGMQTELGHIAGMIQHVGSEQTPLQRRLDQLGRGLALAALALVAIVFALGLLRGEELRLMFLTGVSLAVAAVPEGLPAVVTIALALGAQRMLQRNALIRKLPAVETLGSVTVICSDKTGTLTENRMTVTVLDIAGDRLDLDEALRRDQFRLGTEAARARFPEADRSHTLALLVAGGALCNDAILEQREGSSDAFQVVGDPTEGALVMAAARLGLRKAQLDTLFPRVHEVPFDSERKRMTTVHRLPDSKDAVPPDLLPVWDWDVGIGEFSHVAFTKGAVDSLLEVSNRVWVGEKSQPLALNDAWYRRVQDANTELAKDGMRVLGVALRRVDDAEVESEGPQLERNLVFVGLVAMMDPARPEVKDAVATCKTAGIRPVMITGDHPLTAMTIARELGIADGEQPLTGRDLVRMSPEELKGVVETVSVYARVSPEHKLNIVQALQDRGHIVAMTGDGVNDAPALKKADIGIAMGITGTDVSKEAADMVLQDDNFATIVSAVEQGRVIYDNIRKFIKYTLTSNVGEIWVMLLGPLLGMPLALLPLQILWVNLVTDGLPGLALTLEPAERNTMRRPPYPPDESVFSRGVARDIVWVGIVMGLVPLALGFWYWSSGRETWQTMVFTTLTLAQMGNALAVRSRLDSLFRIGLFSNMALLGAVLLTLAAQLAVVYVPFLQSIFSTLTLPLSDLLICLLASTVVFWSIEIQKWWLRRGGAL